MNYYILALKNYTKFTGRSRRREYWMFALFNFIFIMIAMILDNVIGSTFKIGGRDLYYGYLYLLYALFVIIPGFSVLVRRLHDVGKSGWFFLIGLIPIIGSIWLLVLLCTNSQPGENQYGPNPKENPDPVTAV